MSVFRLSRILQLPQQLQNTLDSLQATVEQPQEE
jgi:hypothetical protein